jgi:hypothetical protein
MKRSPLAGNRPFGSGSRGAGRARRPAHVRPLLERLEDRTAPAVLTVNTLADNTTDTSVLTLRDAVTLVNHGGDPSSLGQSSMPSGWAAQIDTSSGGFGSNDTIQFDPGLFGPTQAAITLGGSELELSSSVTITGPGAGQLAVSGNRASRVFAIDSSVTATVTGLTIANGDAPDTALDRGDGGGIENGFSRSLGERTA